MDIAQPEGNTEVTPCSFCPVFPYFLIITTIHQTIIFGNLFSDFHLQKYLSDSFHAYLSHFFSHLHGWNRYGITAGITNQFVLVFILC